MYDSAAPAVDLVTTTQYDLFGRALVSIDTLNRKVVTDFDRLGRATTVTSYGWTGSASVAIAKSRTAYTGGGPVASQHGSLRVRLGDPG